MPPRITDSQRQEVLALLAQGIDRETVAAQVGVTPGQVSAVAAHIKMRTYAKNKLHNPVAEWVQSELRGRGRGLLEDIGAANRRSQTVSDRKGVSIGLDAEIEEAVFWNPDSWDGVANPHMLILGESGFGKTYAIRCILTELAQQNMPSIVFDYGQDFTVDSSSDPFTEYASTAWQKFLIG